MLCVMDDQETVIDMEFCANFTREEPPDDVVPCNEGRVCPVQYATTDYGPVKK